MECTESPFLERRRLRGLLRRARDASGKTQVQLMKEMRWSSSKVTRVEATTTIAKRNDLKAMLEFYGVTDQDVYDQAYASADVARKKFWWDEHRSVLPAEIVTEISYEASASRLRQFQAHVVPNLLQTERYSRSLHKAVGDDDAVGSRGARIRRELQEEVLRDGGPELFFLLCEAVLWQCVGDPEVMRGQLNHLREMATRPNVWIQVLPFAGGGHPGLRGSFTIFDFPLTEEKSAVRVERTGPGLLMVEEPEEIDPFLTLFARLEEIAVDKAELDTLIDRALAELPT